MVAQPVWGLLPKLTEAVGLQGSPDASASPPVRFYFFSSSLSQFVANVRAASIAGSPAR